MSDKISLGFTGSDTGIARLIADLEEAGATKVTAEPQEADAPHPEARRYEGEITGLEPDKAISAAASYLDDGDRSPGRAQRHRGAAAHLTPALQTDEKERWS